MSNRTEADPNDFPRCPNTHANGVCMYVGPCLTCAGNRARYKTNLTPSDRMMRAHNLGLAMRARQDADRKLFDVALSIDIPRPPRSELRAAALDYAAACLLESGEANTTNAAIVLQSMAEVHRSPEVPK